jgi:hypothetical protein
MIKAKLAQQPSPKKSPEQSKTQYKTNDADSPVEPKPNRLNILVGVASGTDNQKFVLRKFPGGPQPPKNAILKSTSPEKQRRHHNPSIHEEANH